MPSAAGAVVCVLQASQGAELQRQLGNLYTASLFSGLAGLLAQQGAGLAGKRLLCFSYGSGVVASMFCLRGRDVQQQQQEQQQQRDSQQQQQQQYSWQQQACSLQHMADMVRCCASLACPAC
jgi:3-hydroxy-3-methylglutaryl CoA synthase